MNNLLKAIKILKEREFLSSGDAQKCDHKQEQYLI
jgi:hypothetical protein